MFSAGYFVDGAEMFLAVVVITVVVDGQGVHVEISGVFVEEIFGVDVVVVVVVVVDGGRETNSSS